MSQAERVLLTVGELEGQTPFGIEDAHGILDVYAALPSYADVRAWVRVGVRQQGATGNDTLAWALVANGQADVLRELIAPGGLGVTLEDCCARRTTTAYQGKYETTESLVESAIRKMDPAGLARAIAFDPQGVDLVGMRQQVGVDESFLYRATSAAVAGMQRALLCAWILHRRGAPMLNSLYGKTPAMTCLLERPWGPGVAEGLTELMRSFHAAGMLDVNERAEQPVGRILRSRVPLELAISQGSAHAARELVRLGAAVDGFLIKGCKDLLEHVRAVGIAEEAEMLAFLSEALMERKIQSATVHVRSEQAPGHSRPRRAAL
ncbi:hypothetical protein ABIC83_002459 [Roseateles asaccharophilus]|uniref:hypothetical protein n=1 Tax=Roseateles asaccharophilus TaxID=582607 RepID=UPI0038327A76